ncbi:hypothetical protein ACJX0J_013130, partial [Zea mays]
HYLTVDEGISIDLMSFVGGISIYNLSSIIADAPDLLESNLSMWESRNPSGAGGFVGKMENDGWEPLLEEATTFCLANDIPILNMSDVTIKDQLRTFIIHVRRFEELKACCD